MGQKLLWVLVLSVCALACAVDDCGCEPALAWLKAGDRHMVTVIEPSATERTVWTDRSCAGSRRPASPVEPWQHPPPGRLNILTGAPAFGAGAIQDFAT